MLNRAGGEMPAKPHIVGYNAAGVVREVGAEVTDRKIGDRVTAMWANGSHAERFAVPSTATWLVPDGCSLEHAACVPVSWGTANDCLFEFGHLKAGETVLVQAGTSGVGIACVQLAHRAGARVIATSSSDEKLERLRRYGMDIGVNYAAGDFVDAVRKATNGAGVDLVVDSVGGKTLEGSIACAGYRGRVITVGNVSRQGKAIDISGLSGNNVSTHGRLLRHRDVPERGARRADARRHPARHREGRAEGRRRPHVPAVGGRGRARAHREPPGARAGRAGAVGTGARMIELGRFVEEFARSLAAVDARLPVAINQRSGAAFRPGIGPHSEAAAVSLVMADLQTALHPALEYRCSVPYISGSRQRCDLCLGREPIWDWAIELKLLRFLGDNGQLNDNILMHILSPYSAHRSALSDCTKLITSGLAARKAVLIYGFESDAWPLEPAIEAFETLARTRVRPGARHEARFDGLVHPVHQRGAVYAWEIHAL